MPDRQGPPVAELANVMTTTVSYDDGLIQLDRQALTLRRYHFPSGTSKIIPLQAIRGYRVETMGLAFDRFRIWGPPTIHVAGCRWTYGDPSSPPWWCSTYRAPGPARPSPRCAPRSSSPCSKSCWRTSVPAAQSPPATAAHPWSPICSRPWRCAEMHWAAYPHVHAPRHRR